jgi:hypothetical protein
LGLSINPFSPDEVSTKPKGLKTPLKKGFSGPYNICIPVKSAVNNEILYNSLNTLFLCLSLNARLYPTYKATKDLKTHITPKKVVNNGFLLTMPDNNPNKNNITIRTFIVIVFRLLNEFLIKKTTAILSSNTSGKGSLFIATIFSI